MTWRLGRIKAAYDEGEQLGATHMIVSHNNVDFDNIATYVMPGEDPREAWEASWAFSSGHDSVDEVYKYELGWESQSQERRAYHWD